MIVRSRTSASQAKFHAGCRCWFTDLGFDSHEHDVRARQARAESINIMKGKLIEGSDPLRKNSCTSACRGYMAVSAIISTFELIASFQSVKDMIPQLMIMGEPVLPGF